MIELKKSEATTILNLVSKLKIKNDVAILGNGKAIIFNADTNIKAEVFLDYSRTCDAIIYMKIDDIQRIKRTLKNGSDYVEIEKTNSDKEHCFYKVHVNDKNYFESRCDIDNHPLIDTYVSYSENELLNIDPINLCSPYVGTPTTTKSASVRQLHIEKGSTIATDGKQMKVIENSQNYNITCNIDSAVLPLMETYKNKKWYITKKDTNNNRLLNTDLFDIIYKDIEPYPIYSRIVPPKNTDYLTEINLNVSLLDQLKEFKKISKKVSLIKILFKDKVTTISDTLNGGNNSYIEDNKVIGNINVNIDYMITLLELAPKEGSYLQIKIRRSKDHVVQYYIYNEDNIYFFMGINNTVPTDNLLKIN